jgi:cation transport regulator ChaC
MTHYFAYGSNMNRAHMRRHCPGAKAIGTATVADFRFLITTNGYASIVPQSGGIVHGVLWRLTPRDVAALNAYESLDSGLYATVTLPVRREGRRVAAMAYVARSRSAGRPKAGYLDVILAAAREWKLPEAYVRSLARWSPTRWRGIRAAESGEIG